MSMLWSLFVSRLRRILLLLVPATSATGSPTSNGIIIAG